MFDFELTGRNPADENDRQRGINAAQDYCALHGIDPAKAYKESFIAHAPLQEKPSLGDWSAIEGAAISAMCSNWYSKPENVSLIWR